MASDAELIGRSLTGDGEAFVEVICRHEAVARTVITWPGERRRPCHTHSVRMLGPRRPAGQTCRPAEGPGTVEFA